MNVVERDVKLKAATQEVEQFKKENEKLTEKVK